MLSLSNSISRARASKKKSVLLVPQTGLILAVSSKKLVPAYSGNCITLQRDSDAAIQSFGFNADAAIASFLGGQTGFVTAWFNQVYATMDFVSLTTATRPTWSSSLKRIIFDGTTQLRLSTFPVEARTPLTSTSGFSYFFRAKSTSANTASKTLLQHAGGNFATAIELFWNNPSTVARINYVKTPGDSIQALSSVANTMLNNENIVYGATLNYTTGQTRLYKNSTVIATGTTVITSSEATYPRQFNLAYPGFGTNRFIGDIESGLIYNRGLSAAEVDQVLLAI